MLNLNYMESIIYTAKNIAHVLEGNHQIVDPSSVINHLIIDSRRAHHFEQSLFIALVGDYRDGHQFIEDLYEKGVRNFLVSHPVKNVPEANVFVVTNTTKALQKIAQNKREKFDIPVIGITGSNGKTIVKEWLFQLLNTDFNIVRSPKSYNSQIGVPLSVWGMNETHNLAIFEAGISMPSEMEKLEKIIHPTFGIFTNIGQAHQENFESMRQKVKEKMKLFTHADYVIYQCDSEVVSPAMKAVFSKKKLLGWGKCNDADLNIISVKKMGDVAKISAVYQKEKVALTIPFSDNASIENAINCWMYMLHTKHSSSEIQERFNRLEPIAMRLEQKEGIDGSVILNDSYNADVTALEIALDDMMRLNRNGKTVILSDILQSGETPDKLYKRVNEILVSHKIHRFIGIGQEIFEHQELFQFHSEYFYENTQQFLDEFHKYDFSNQGILVKGARKFRFEKIVSKLALKSHQTVLKIYLDALKHNLNFYRKKLDANVKTMVMVKAYGYGAGGPEVARILDNSGVDYLGVAHADEGVAIRKAGISIPIMVMNPAPEAFATMINFDLEPEIYSLEVFEEFNKVLQTEGIFSSSYKIHLKIDTGMNRLGFRPENIDGLLKALKRQRHFKVASVFSHLVGSDDSEFDQFTQNQIDLFTRVSSKIEESIGYSFIQHIANTGAIERFPNAQFDMVRLGIGLYGIAVDKKNQKQLETVSSLHSIVVQIKNVNRGESIGYSRGFMAYTDMKIAVIPVGYADGLDRRLSNGVGFVFISGEKRPIVGSVCMDLIMVDVTGLDTTVNERVEIFGPNIPVYVLAKRAKTISYEILSGIPPRVKRVYIKEDS